MDDAWDADRIDARLEMALRSNKWEGEDEEEDVKESWEDVDEEEEKKDVEKPAEAPKAKPKPKKKVAEKIEEKERKAREEAERKAKEKEEAMTPEERRAEQLRRQKMAEEADLRLAMETFGVTAIDAMMPDTKEEFESFGESLLQKINQFSKHTEYPAFAEDLISRIAVNLPSTSLKKLGTTINNLAIEKQKLEKGDKGKKSKGKGKAKLKIEGENSHLSEYDTYGYDNEYDDFM
ncbi:eukaryotic translation initiation factor 3 subunit J [Chelonus insularis]|uniref:eukaryotic translation initiation factor 3 subunit J n=1 Tax=Chelonus insularis TaxID=460826 RepID=UPI00158CF970|nr:eukaryotic translation initiation factor 3 subunit J [Chelonus insularis]